MGHMGRPRRRRGGMGGAARALALGLATGGLRNEVCVYVCVFLCCCCLVLLEKSLEEIGLVLSSPASLLGAIMIASRASVGFFPDHRSGSSDEPRSINANLLQVAAPPMYVSGSE